MFKKIIFTTPLLNINNIRCSEEESSENKKINEIKEKINSLYTYGKEPFELYKEKKNIKNYNLEADKDSVKKVHNTNDISSILNVKIDKNNSYFHFLKTLDLLKLYLLNSLNNIDKNVINILETFIKKNYQKNSDEDKNKQDSNKIVENIYLDFIKLGLEKIRNRVNSKNFEKFKNNEFEYIKDDYFENKKTTLKEEYKNLESYKKELYDNLRNIKGECLSKFLKSDDLDLDGYFPIHWETSLKIAKQFEVLKRNMYNYNFCNEGIKNKEDNDVIKSSEELQKKFNKEDKKEFNDVLKKITKYSEFANYLKLFEDFNNSINVLKIDENITFLNNLEKEFEKVIKIKDEDIVLNTELYNISEDNKNKITNIKKNIDSTNDTLNNVKTIFNEFSNDKYKNFIEKYNEFKKNVKNYSNKISVIKKIKNEINTLISEIKTKINTLTENDKNLEDEYKVKIPTVDDDDYKKKTKNELNDIKNNLEALEKTQEKNRKKQKDEKDKALLAAAKNEEEKSKIQDSINLRNQILTKIKEICKNFEKEYNPTENDNKIKIEKNLDLKLNEYKDIKEYLEDEFNKEKGLSKTLQNDLNSEKTKTINNCELKLNNFLQKKKEEEEEKKKKEEEKEEEQKNKNEEKKGNSEDGNNKNIEDDNEDKCKIKCCCGNKGENNNKSKKKKKICC